MRSWTSEIEEAGIHLNEKNLSRNDIGKVLWTIAEREEAQEQDREYQRLKWTVIGIFVGFFAFCVMAYNLQEWHDRIILDFRCRFSLANLLYLEPPPCNGSTERPIFGS